MLIVDDHPVVRTGLSLFLLAFQYTLSVVSQSASQTACQDFQVLNPSTFDDGGYYCVSGQLSNAGASLQNYLVVVAVLFNAQNQVINFDSYEEPYPEEIRDSQTSGFEICIDPFEQSVARYELRAWGQ